MTFPQSYMYEYIYICLSFHHTFTPSSELSLFSYAHKQHRRVPCWPTQLHWLKLPLVKAWRILSTSPCWSTRSCKRWKIRMPQHALVCRRWDKLLPLHLRRKVHRWSPHHHLWSHHHLRHRCHSRPLLHVLRRPCRRRRPLRPPHRCRPRWPTEHRRGGGEDNPAGSVTNVGAPAGTAGEKCRVEVSAWLGSWRKSANVTCAVWDDHRVP